MNYLLLIYSNEAEMKALGEAALKKMSDEYTEFTKTIVQGGQFKAGDRLKPVSTVWVMSPLTSQPHVGRGAPTERGLKPDRDIGRFLVRAALVGRGAPTERGLKLGPL